MTSGNQSSRCGCWVSGCHVGPAYSSATLHGSRPSMWNTVEAGFCPVGVTPKKSCEQGFLLIVVVWAGRPTDSFFPVTSGLTAAVWNRLGRYLLVPVWWQAAACLNMDPDIFHPQQSEHVVSEVAELATSTCRVCPIRLRCLDYAICEPLGIWGEWKSENRKIVRRLPDRACPFCLSLVPRGLPRIFCSDACVEATMSASRRERAVVEARIDELNRWATEWNRERRKPGVKNPAPPIHEAVCSG